MRPLVAIVTLAVTLVATLVLGGCPTVDVGEEPIDPASCEPDFTQYRDEVWPMALAPADTTKSCVAESGCHSRATGRSAMRLIENPMNDAEHRQNYEAVTRFLNCANAIDSQLITKPATGREDHGGGDLWTIGAAPADLVEAWIETAP